MIFTLLLTAVALYALYMARVASRDARRAVRAAREVLAVARRLPARTADVLLRQIDGELQRRGLAHGEVDPPMVFTSPVNADGSGPLTFYAAIQKGCPACGRNLDDTDTDICGQWLALHHIHPRTAPCRTLTAHVHQACPRCGFEWTAAFADPYAERVVAPPAPDCPSSTLESPTS